MIDKLKLPPFSLALSAAMLFGASTPAAKVLLGHIQPIFLAGLLYLGSGLGLSIYSLIQFASVPERSRESLLTRSDLPWLVGAILFGGVAGPLLFMVGLSTITSSTTSILLNLEGAFTALLAWFVFKENFDRHIAMGMFAILCGGLFLSYSPGAKFSIAPGALAIAAACLCWAIDNNLTRKISGADPLHTAALKGLVAGAVNCATALALGNVLPKLSICLLAGLVGLFGYGISLSLYIRSLRYLGTARTGAYFSTAPFVGAVLSIALLREPITSTFLLSAGLMAIGVWLHATESHSHMHTHEESDHEHMHIHDQHHQHDHEGLVETNEPHSHLHHHKRITHSHPHFPDTHHRHQH
jgi:drug/metabolite transporter (DMT)-like permease